MLEILAGIPTVVYGYFALLFVTPILQTLIPGTAVFNGLSASIVMGIMILPMVSSLSEDAMAAVPRALREGGYALGATKFEVATQDRRAGRVLGHRGGVHPRRLAGHRRDDDRRDRRRHEPEPDPEPAACRSRR